MKNLLVMRYLFITLVLIFSQGCKRSMEAEAKKAASELCNCVQENLFVYNKSSELYWHCDSILGSRYRLMQMYYTKISDDEYNSSLPRSTKDSIERFMNYFLGYADSCLSIPHQEPHPF